MSVEVKNPLTIKIESWFGVFLIVSAVAFVLITTFSAMRGFEDEINGLTIQRATASQ